MEKKDIIKELAATLGTGGSDNFMEAVNRISLDLKEPNTEEPDIYQDELIDQYKECFSTPAGKAVLGDLVDRFFHTAILDARTASTEETYLGWWRQGRQEVVSHVGVMLELANHKEKQDERS